MSIPAFWRSTWKDVQVYIIAYERKQLTEWQRTRALAHMIYRGAGGDIDDITKFWPMAGDPKPDRPPLSKEELAKVFSIYQSKK